MVNQENAETLLAGDGETGALMCAVDWTATPLGPVEAWPQSLVAALRLLRNARQPMFLWWGDDLVQFYNDASIPLLGEDKHPSGMGQPGRAVWPEAFESLEPMLRAALRDGRASRLEEELRPVNRPGFVEACYFDYAFTPLPDDTGAVGGVLCTVTETTGDVLRKRRLRTLHDLRTLPRETTAKACENTVRILAENAHDLPFALLYLVEDSAPTNASEGRATLAGAAGLDAVPWARPPEVHLGAPGDAKPWPLARVVQTGQATLLGTPAGHDAPEGKAGALPGGPWPEPTRQCLLLPVLQPGQQRPAAILIVGISPRRRFDEAYCRFLDLAADQIAAALQESACAGEKKDNRAAELDATTQSLPEAVAVNTDITDHIRTEEALRNSEARKQAILTSALDGIITMGHHGRILEFNSAAERIFGYARADVIGRPLEEVIIPPRLREAHRRGLERFLETGRSSILDQRVEMPAMRADGSEFPAELTVTCSQVQDEPPFFTGYLRDITGRKEAEAGLQEAQQRASFLARASALLAASSLDLEEMLQQVADLAASHLADWCTVQLAGEDDTVERVATAHRNPDKAKWARTLARHYPFDPEAPHGVVAVIRTGQSALYETVTDDMLAATAQDETHLKLLRHLGLTSAMVVPLQVHGHILGAITFASADSDRHYTETDMELAQELAHRAATSVHNARLYQEAKQARAHAEEMTRLKSAFLENMGHEVRTPLTGIIGFASTLAPRLSGKERDFAQRIERNGVRLMDTIDAVLSLSQLEARQTELHTEVVPVAKEVRQIALRMQPRARQQELAFSVTVAPDAEAAHAALDRGALNSILHNLIDNAIKFTDEGSIDVMVEADATHVQVHVDDTGTGIDAAFRPHLFDPFRQASSGWNRSHEGVGLGLPVAQRLAALMNGEIRVQSEQGQGSRFTLCLPLAQKSGEAPPPSPDHQAPQQTAAREGARMLIVEDNPDSRLLMQTLLEELGDVTAVSSAAEALAEAKRAANVEGPPSPFDFALIDINLGPGEKNGQDVLDELRAIPDYQTVPMAAVTAYSTTSDKEKLLAHGFDAFLRKPFKAPELLDLASQLMHSRN